MQLKFWCQQKLKNNLMCHPVEIREQSNEVPEQCRTREVTIPEGKKVVVRSTSEMVVRHFPMLDVN